jgi:hypothetical protein
MIFPDQGAPVSVADEVRGRSRCGKQLLGQSRASREVAGDMRAPREMGVGGLDFGFRGSMVDAMLGKMEQFRKEVLVLV